MRWPFLFNSPHAWGHGGHRSMVWAGHSNVPCWGACAPICADFKWIWVRLWIIWFHVVIYKPIYSFEPVGISKVLVIFFFNTKIMELKGFGNHWITTSLHHFSAKRMPWAAFRYHTSTLQTFPTLMILGCCVSFWLHNSLPRCQLYRVHLTTSNQDFSLSVTSMETSPERRTLALG